MDNLWCNATMSADFAILINAMSKNSAAVSELKIQLH